MSGRPVNLTTLFLARLRPPKRLTSTSCTYFRQYLTTALPEKVEGEMKVCSQTGYRTQDPWLTSQVPYRLRSVRLSHRTFGFPSSTFVMISLNFPVQHLTSMTISHNFGLSECNRVKNDICGQVCNYSQYKQSVFLFTFTELWSKYGKYCS